MSDERLAALEKTVARLAQAVESFQVSAVERRQADDRMREVEQAGRDNRDYIERSGRELQRRDADLRQGEEAIERRELRVADREAAVDAREKAFAQAKARMQSHLQEVT